jgi:hypothetical protein
MRDMTDDIGYQITDEDVKAVVGWLKINDPDNATEEYARKMLDGMRSMFREMGKIDVGLLYKALEDYKKNKS